MDIDTVGQKAQQPISDDQELAKVLAGINDQDAPAAPEAVERVVPSTPMPDPIDTATDDATPTPADDTAVADETPVVAPTTAPATDGLDSVKQQAIEELRPLVDKLNISPEEKFDTYLLLLRSTDDRTLVAPAHETATQISDEARRAQALLDIIKEIDFLNQQSAA